MPSFDLSTLDLDVGTHIITARANATGLAQSLDSNSVTFHVYSVTKTLSHCAITTGNISKLYQNASAALTITADTGYELPDSVTVTGATHTWDKATGTLTLSNPTGNITVTVTAVILLPQLATPANLTADGTTISFDEVENAEKYEVFADGTSIGEYEVPSGYSVNIQKGSSLIANCCFYSLDNGSSWEDVYSQTFPLENITQIKFKAQNNGFFTGVVNGNTISVDTGYVSENYALTNDITELLANKVNY